MALTDAFLQDSRDAADLHVVRGVPSTRLDQKLRIRDDASPNTIFTGDNPPPNVDVQFHPHFEPELPLGLEFTSAHGVRVHSGFAGTPGTGVVTVEPPPPGGRRLHNFLLTASVTDRIGDKPPIRRTIRVHVHDAITRAWLTPSTLTVRPDGHIAQFSLLAEFDDGVVGDIGNWTPLRWATIPPPAAPPAIPDIEMFSETLGWVRGHRVGAEATATVEYAPLAWPHPPPTGTVMCREDWATPRELTWVAGKDPAKWLEVPNVLFLPDGFVDGERDLFHTLVRNIVRKLRTSSVLRPFDLLYDEMNFWAAFVPSPEAGVNVLYEMKTFTVHADPFGEAVPFPAVPAATAPTWSLAELIHEVGLPVASDATRNLEGPGGLLADWQQVYGPKVTKPRVEQSWKEWRELASRTLVNQRDTLFGLSLGSRPRAENNTFVRLLTLHTGERTGTTDLDRLLVNLHYRGQSVGVTWRIFASPAAGLPSGKDLGLVCILSRTRLHGGVNADNYYTSSLYSAGAHLTRPSARGGVDIVPPRIKLRSTALPPGEAERPYVDVDDPSFEQVVGTVAHETVHSLHLGDEYGEKSDQTHKVLPASIPPHLDSLAEWGNVQDQGSLLTSGKLHAASIKWGRWHRIETAGVLADPPVPAGSGFRLTLRPGHAGAFKKEDLVRLRTRPLVPGSVVSDVLRVKERPVGNQAHLDVEVMFGGSLTPSNFQRGSVLMRMVRWPFRGLGTNLGDELKLMATIIRDHIEATGLPLNARPGRVLAACDLDDASQQPARNLPDGLPKCRPRNRNRIVGLYEGGSTYHCEVYHPTGACVMRARREGQHLIPFCPVCRYVLVDLIDPTQHGIIDRDYAKIYPDPRT